MSYILFAFLSAFFAGVTSILAKVGIKDVDSHLATAIRTAVVVVFSWLMVFIKTDLSEAVISSKALLFLVLSGLTTGASWMCYFYALKIGNINVVVPIDKSSTVLAMLLGVIFLDEKLTILKAVCMVLIAVGTILMINKKEASSKKKTSYIFYALLSAVFAAATSILGKVGVENVDSDLGTAIRTIVVLIMAWLIVFAGKKESQIKKIDKKSFMFIILSGFATGASWLCYYRALSTGDAGIVVPIDKLSILITVAFSYIVFGEKLKVKNAFGLAMITLGTLLLLI